MFFESVFKYKMSQQQAPAQRRQQAPQARRRNQLEPGFNEATSTNLPEVDEAGFDIRDEQ